MIYVVIIGFIVAAEYVIKQHMEKSLSEDKDIMKGKVRLNLYHNKGIALNALEKNLKLIKIVTGTMIGVLMLALAYGIGAKQSKLRNLGLSLLLGGALSNFIDRMKQGYVTDYFSFHKPKKISHIVFNLADFAVFLGGAILVIAEMMVGNKK